MNYVICVGNVCEGFEFIGPFAGDVLARGYMANDDRDYELILLQEPAKDSELSEVQA